MEDTNTVAPMRLSLKSLIALKEVALHMYIDGYGSNLAI